MIAEIIARWPEFAAAFGGSCVVIALAVQDRKAGAR